MSLKNKNTGALPLIIMWDGLYKSAQDVRLRMCELVYDGAFRKIAGGGSF